MIFTRAVTCPIHDKILKFIWSKKLKERKKIQYLKISQDLRNFSPKNTNAKISEKIKKNTERDIPIMKKFFVRTFFIIRILSISPLELSSEKTGNNSQKIGPIARNGIVIKER